ncbi:MAG: hypothetical protein JEY79_09245 [Pseudodesulfovibrio sp.]|nr:hypothetical protein [Pseudodesulfovibrio sp.]
MSFSKIGDYNAIAALQAGKGVGGAGKNGAQDAQLQAAFSKQMEMTQSLFGDGSERYGEGDSFGSFDSSLINDSRMFDALTTISRLMRDEAGLPQRTVAPQVGAARMQQSVPASQPLSGIDVGSLSARFESGGAGVAAIGYDRVGGTSYGKYQIASKPGTMDRFLEFLDEKAPEWAGRLRNAGPTNTGSRDGGMPTEWKAIAGENSQLFEKLQHDFIGKETYMPARDMILKQTGLDFDNAPPALREVLWSTSVQHGPTGAARIFNKTIDRFVGSGSDGDFNSKLIEGVYDTRKGQFGSSTKRVQQSVVSRLNTEKQLALNMLGKTQVNRIV